MDLNDDNIEKIAKIVHQTNKAFCESLGDNSQVNWEDAPEWQKNSAIMGVKLHAGNEHSTAKDSHVSWYKLKESEGWVYGPVKNPELKQHPCMVEFEKLPIFQQMKDHLFRNIVHTLVFTCLDD